MPTTPRLRSTAEARRAEVLRAGLTVFARNGYAATPVTEVAEAAGITQGYVQRLFGSKLELFVAVVHHCYERICDCLTQAADESPGTTPADILDAMSEAYAALIADRSLLMVQVHAQAATGEPQVQAAVRDGLRSLIELTRERSGASDHEVQQFLAFGQLCHLIVTTRLDTVDQRWARTLTAGMRHP